jgi:predicted permease
VNTWNLFQLMVVLFAMMLVGYGAYRKNLIDDNAYTKICGLIVHIFNPMLIISGVVGKDLSQTGSLISQNLLLVVILFAYLIFISGPVTALLRIPKEKRPLHQLMLIFSNLGFMGIPLITSLYGSEKVIFVSFYILVFNILAYTLGIYLLGKGQEQKNVFSFRKIVNTGTIACVAAIILFYCHIPVAQPVLTFVSYMGNTAVPLSMMMIGVSLAKSNLGALLRQVSRYKFMLMKMLVLPIVIILILKQFSFDGTLLGIFLLMIAMPVASVVPMLAELYGKPGDGQEAAQMVALTTVISLVTLPLVSLTL